jgi:hypothetical protein
MCHCSEVFAGAVLFVHELSEHPALLSEDGKQWHKSFALPKRDSRRLRDGAIEVGQLFDSIKLCCDFGCVGNEKQRHVMLAARLTQQLQDRLLIGDVDVGRRFIRQ